MPGIYLAGNDRYRHKKKKKHIIKYEEKKVRGKRRSSERWSHTCRRFVRFPIDGDKVPERDWLGAPLHREKSKSESEKGNAEKEKEKVVIIVKY